MATSRLRSNVLDVLAELDGLIEQVTSLLNVLGMDDRYADGQLDVAYIAIATLREQVARLKEEVGR